MKAKLVVSLILFTALVALCSEVRAFTPSIAPNGAAMRWKQPLTFHLAGNPKGSTGISPQDFSNSVILGLQRWQAASQGSVNFEYWQGTDPANFPRTAANDGLSTIFFTSQSDAPNRLSASILGSTQVWYNTDTGEIYEADILLNDKDFYFTSNPSDSTEPPTGSIQFTKLKPRVFIQNTITHELGHALGLSHSGNMNASMLFMEAPDQAYLGCDDQVGIQSLYPASHIELTGAMHGTVHFGQSPIFGAHVVAISAQRGTILASALTDPSGTFHFPRLEPGNYFLMAEPYYAGAAPLPHYFSTINPTFCQNKANQALTEFKRTFLTSSTNNPFELETISVTSGDDTSAGDISVQCEPIPESTESPPVNLSERNRFAFLDSVPYSTSKTYSLENVSGNLTLYVMSFSLYSRVKATLSLTDENNTVVGRYSNPNYQSSTYRSTSGNSGFQNYDGILTAENLSGNYTLHLTTQSASAYYPAGSLSLDSNPFLIVFGSAAAAAPVTSSESSDDSNPDTAPNPLPSSPVSSQLAQNARCRALEDFPTYSSPPGNPIRHFTPGASGTLTGSAAVGCGRLSTPNEKKSDSRPPLALAVSWFIPWLLIFLHRPIRTIKLSK